MNRLKELRLSAGLSQSDLAKSAETTQRNISYWESGKVEINLYAAIRLAQILQVDIEYLAGYSDEFNIKPEITLPKSKNAKIDAPMPERAGAGALTREESKLIEQYRSIPEQLRKIIREQLEIYSSTEELLPKQNKKV